MSRQYLSQLSGAFKALASSAAPHVVSVSSHRRASTGFLWKDGLIVMADEALAEEGEISVTLHGGTRVPAQLVGRDPSTDVALLRIEARPSTAKLPNDGLAELGELAAVVGSEQGEPVTSLGVVARASGAWNSMRGGAIDQRIELDLSMRRAQEGGLALAADGRLLGMAVFGPRRRVLVIPASTIVRVAGVLETKGRIPRGYLGLGLQPVEVAGGGSGAMVLNVDPKGPGLAAGILQGDIIVTWNNENVEHVRKLVRALGSDSVGSTIALGVSRAGQRRNVQLTIGERPAG